MGKDEMCYCSKQLININDASYVAIVHSMVRPFCETRCFQRFLESEALHAELERREHATRITGSFEEGFTVEDRMPREVYSRRTPS